MKDLIISFPVAGTAEHAFKSINQVSKWWTENIEGSSQRLNDEFTVRFGDVHVSTQKIVEFIPGRKVVWLVTYSNLSFVKDKQEWTNTKISFEVTNEKNQTQINFSHLGLTPAEECFKDCSNAWGQYLNHSLRNLVNSGIGNPTRRNA